MQNRRQLIVLAALAGIAAPALAQQAFAPGDIALGRSVSNVTNTLLHLRPDVPNLNTDVGTSWGTGFMQSVEFDNLNGIRHNARGNLLGLNFGTNAAGGSLAIFATGAQSAANPQNSATLYAFNAANLGVRTRVGGLSVSPTNTRIALTGSDPAVTGESNGRLIIMDYTAGDGNANGAAVANPTQITLGGINGRTTGTAWLDSNRVMLLNTATDEFGGVTVGNLQIVDVTDVNNPVITNPQSDLFSGFNLTFTSISYEPTVSPYVAISGSGFAGGTVNKMRFLDPANNFAPVTPLLDYSTSIGTMRELHWDEDGNLIAGAFGGSTTTPAPADTKMMNAIVGAFVPATLADNTNTPGLWEIGAVQSSFNGHDVALTHIDYVNPDVTVDIGTGSYTQKFLGDSPEAAVFAKLVIGYNSGAWDGENGILSSDAAANTAFAVGYEFGADTFTLKYTLRGDTNLTGVVDFDDLLALAQNYNQTATNWSQGDFDYNGTTDFSDLLGLAQNYGSGALTAGQYDQLVTLAGPGLADFARSVVPEPATLGLLAGAGLLALRRRA
jgi:hypothetical protein